MASSMKTVTVTSKDHHDFEVPIHVAEQSKLIKQVLDDVGLSGTKIPLVSVNSVTLAKVIEYCQKHADNEPAADGGAANNAGRRVEELKEWDAEFFKLDDKLDLLFDIILAANYMDIKNLFDASCQAVADMIKGKTVEDVRGIFKIKSDFTSEEEKRNRKENQWAFKNN